VRRAAAALALLVAAPAAAQSPSDFLPGLATPPAPASVAPEPQAAPAAPVAAGGPSFILRGVRLEGATAIPEAELAPLWQEMIGRPVGLGELDALAVRISAAYRARGFVLSQAGLPPQAIDDGVATVQVIEGFIDRVAIAGGAENQRRLATELIAPVTAERPLRIETLERGVLLGRDLFGGGVETALEPSPTTFGAADLTVEITSTPVTGFASVDNRGSRLYGDWSFAAGATGYNLLGLNERLDLVTAGALDGSLGYVQGAFAIPLRGVAGTRLDGAVVAFEADYADGSPDLSRAGGPDSQTLTTEETNLRAALKVPFIRTRAQNLHGEIGLDWQDSRNVTGFGGDEAVEDDRLLVLDLALSWDRADRIGGVTLVEAGLRQGIDAGGAVVGGGPAYGKPDFTLATLGIARLQRLGAGGWSIWLEGIAQYGFDILPNSERFSLGDTTIGRGFAPGDVTGDSGYGGRIELRRQVQGAALDRLAAGAELYAYGDYGQAYDRDDDRDGARWETLGSAGIGARIDVRPWLTITPEIARQLEGVPTDTRDPSLETRFYIGAVARF